MSIKLYLSEWLSRQSVRQHSIKTSSCHINIVKRLKPSTLAHDSTVVQINYVPTIQQSKYNVLLVAKLCPPNGVYIADSVQSSFFPIRLTDVATSAMLFSKSSNVLETFAWTFGNHGICCVCKATAKFRHRKSYISFETRRTSSIPR